LQQWQQNIYKVLDKHLTLGYNRIYKEINMIIAEKESEAYANPDLTKKVQKDTPLKEWLVDYTGRKYQAERARCKAETGKEFEWDGSVTVEMIVETMMSDFPEFLMAVAEENFIRGYRQAFVDTEAGMEMANAEQEQQR